MFSAEVYEDGDLTTVNEQDREWEDRGNTAFVYDAPYVRHWDRYVGPKRSALFSVPLSRRLDGKWVLEPQWTNLLRGTGHVSGGCVYDEVISLTECLELAGRAVWRDG